MKFVSFKALADEMKHELKQVYAENLPQACVLALNRTAMQVREKLKDDMRRKLDKPRPETINGMLVTKARIDSLAAVIRIKDNRPGSNAGPPVGHYLASEILGDAREAKRSERALELSGVMPAADFYIPSKKDALDAYGNLPRSVIIDALAGVKAAPAAGYVANDAAKRAAKRKRKPRGGPFFVAKSKTTGKPLGIWQVVSKGVVKPVLIFSTRDPHYEVRFPFEELAAEHAKEIFPVEFEKAIRELAAK